jgi:hypothetical protein
MRKRFYKNFERISWGFDLSSADAEEKNIFPPDVAARVVFAKHRVLHVFVFSRNK